MCTALGAASAGRHSTVRGRTASQSVTGLRDAALTEEPPAARGRGTRARGAQARGLAPHAEVRRFWEARYCAGLMRLVVVGPQLPAELEALVRARFGAVRNRGLAPPEFPGAPAPRRWCCAVGSKNSVLVSADNELAWKEQVGFHACGLCAGAVAAQRAAACAGASAVHYWQRSTRARRSACCAARRLQARCFAAASLLSLQRALRCSAPPGPLLRCRPAPRPRPQATW
jgi:hypothetical protein